MYQVSYSILQSCTRLFATHVLLGKGLTDLLRTFADTVGAVLCHVGQWFAWMFLFVSIGHHMSFLASLLPTSLQDWSDALHVYLKRVEP